ncbi:MAG: DedA family protein [Desulfamplus sp.]|nr:DedA family protein [Desulfamplus sp.]
MLKKLYDWVLGWAERPGGTWALFILAFCESSFFPIPPDVLLIALAVGAPSKAFRFALVCSVGSVLGGIVGYIIGWQFMGIAGERIIAFYGLGHQIDYIATLFRQWDAWAVAIAGFTPIPYKLFTISAGAFDVSFPVFVISSAASRTLRFVLVAGMIYFFGAGIRNFIEKYFNLLATAFTVLLIAGFVAIKFLF